PRRPRCQTAPYPFARVCPARAHRHTRCRKFLARGRGGGRFRRDASVRRGRVCPGREGAEGNEDALRRRRSGVHRKRRWPADKRQTTRTSGCATRRPGSCWRYPYQTQSGLASIVAMNEPGTRLIRETSKLEARTLNFERTFRRRTAVSSTLEVQGSMLWCTQLLRKSSVKGNSGW